ncbi:RAD51-associated protein 1-like [Sinocyclocheilus rhinocerous]|uniref:RAD51-associated protein 1-like n=1 Tax=Sinocyclocheilus rhinocerous TaxID=307959 RepID=A0A673H849_9TELE|nr:PREDICTED: RAD51-associated protein 1-like [Sinocyclocheilus rhinocerous]
MDRPSRDKKAVNYAVLQDDDGEDFACVKPPPKKARTAIKDPDSLRNHKTTSASPNEVVDLTSSGSRKRTSVDDKLYERDLETALLLSLLDRTQDGEPTTKTDDNESSQPPQCSPPVLIHCSAEGSHLVGEGQPAPDSPPVLSNCSIDGRSLGLNLISIDTSPTSVSKQKETSKEQRKPLKEKKDSRDDEDYQPQNTPDSESDADFTEEDESEDETFTVKKKKKVVKQKAPPAAKNKTEKKDKKPTKASKAKSSAPIPAICRSPAAPVSGLKKTPTTPPLSKPAVCSSPAGARLPKWNPPGQVGRSPGASQNAHVKSPGQGLRLGLSRLARVKPLHPNAAAN